MKLLVLATDYPNLNGGHSLKYIHTRNLNYLKNGIDVIVLNFSTQHNYSIDGIMVISLTEFKHNISKYNDYILLSHAPNIRYHYFFLKRYSKIFKNIVFFFHGHEVVKINDVYPKTYNFVKTNLFINVFRDFYDNIKLKIWHNYFPKIIFKSHFVFVSYSLLNEFKKYVNINSNILKGRVSVIYNCVGHDFEINNYNCNTAKKYDFITIRNRIDESCYSIDLVTQIAKNNPHYNFLIIGNGKYYDFNVLPKNAVFLKRVLNHDEIISFLNTSKYALMPTRRDTQGLMSCEMATFGIPLITSDLDVCKEVFASFKNVVLINNNDLETINLDNVINKLHVHSKKNTKFFCKNTCDLEIKLFEKLRNNN